MSPTPLPRHPKRPSVSITIGADEGIGMRRILGALLLLAPLALPLSAADAAKPKCFGETATIIGTSKGEPLYGTDKRDVIWGGKGRDHLFGRGGSDLLCGGDGNDVIDGFAGNDKADGGAGSDHITGHGGADKIFGGPGDDENLWGEGGDDIIKGGTGFDSASGDAGIDGCFAEQIDCEADISADTQDAPQPVEASVDDTPYEHEATFENLGPGDARQVNIIIQVSGASAPGPDTTEYQIGLAAPVECDFSAQCIVPGLRKGKTVTVRSTFMVHCSHASFDIVYGQQDTEDDHVPGNNGATGSVPVTYHPGCNET